MNPLIGALVRPLHAVLEGIRRLFQPSIDHLLRDWKQDEYAPDPDFVNDADRFMVQQQPLRARVLAKSIGVALSVFILWAAVAELDEVTRGEGKVVPSQQVQILQSLDGGIVSEILVREGQIVDRDQVLLRIDPTRFVSSVRENRSQYLALATRAARLRAISDNLPFVPPPEALAEAPEVAADERNHYQSDVSKFDAQVSVLRQQLAQKLQEVPEAKAKRDQAANSHELTLQELKATKPLLGVGAVSQVDVLRLERDVSRYAGERDVATTQIARGEAAISEARKKIEELEANFRNEARNALSETLGKLGTLTEGSVGLQDKVKHASLRSPVRGTVKRLLVNTIGGVVQPGKDIVEIVPLEDSLLVEARISPRDIGFLRPNQPAMVRFTAYDFSVYGGLEAKLEHIGADTVSDERNNFFYTVRVRTTKPAIREDLPIIPGMVTEVDIVTGRKTVLAYLLKPVLRAKQAALTER